MNFVFFSSLKKHLKAMVKEGKTGVFQKYAIKKVNNITYVAPVDNEKVGRWNMVMYGKGKVIKGVENLVK